MVAARCLSEGLWGSAGASELPPTLQGEEGRKEVVSLGEWLTPSTSHYAAVLSGGGFRGSQRMLSISKQLGEGNRERKRGYFSARQRGFAGVSLFPLHSCLCRGQTLGVPLLLSGLPCEKGTRTSVLLIIWGRVGCGQGWQRGDF